jgi:hypothetical protein
MWTYEQFMSTLNRYILNRAHLEGSIIEAYTTEEAMNYRMRYIQDGRVIGLPIHQYEGEPWEWGARGEKYAPMYKTK